MKEELIVMPLCFKIKTNSESLCWFQNWKNMNQNILQNQKMYKVNKPDLEEAQFLANLCEVLWLTFVFLSSAGLSFSSRLKKTREFLLWNGFRKDSQFKTGKFWLCKILTFSSFWKKFDLERARILVKNSTHSVLDVRGLLF